MLAEAGHGGGGHGEGFALGRRHQADQPGHVLVSHQAGEQLDKLRLEICV